MIAIAAGAPTVLDTPSAQVLEPTFPFTNATQLTDERPPMKKLLAALTFLLMPSFAFASPVTFAFSGVASIILTHETVLFDGNYTFDSDAIGQPSFERGTGYASVGPPYGMHITLGAITPDFIGVGIGVLK